jgi:lipid A oxidase
MRRLPIVVLALAVLLPSPANADWLLSFYTGGSDTASNTVDITPAAGPTVSIANVDYEGHSWEAPLYYGYRIGWIPDGHHVGVEAEFTHAKAIASTIPSTELTAFQLSHGLNFILGNVVYRTSPYCGGRCAFVARGGVGITYPHVEATFRGVTTYEYEYAGFGAQVGLGIEFKVVPHLFVVADGRLTHARVRTDLADGGRLAGPFTTGHADFGIAWRSSR